MRILVAAHKQGACSKSSMPVTSKKDALLPVAVCACSAPFTIQVSTSKAAICSIAVKPAEGKVVNNILIGGAVSALAPVQPLQQPKHKPMCSAPVYSYSLHCTVYSWSPNLFSNLEKHVWLQLS
jgi:hypothetical protein